MEELREAIRLGRFADYRRSFLHHQEESEGSE
jgi:hypothetical protein